MADNKKQETANYVMAAIAGAAFLIVLREIVDASKKNAKSYIATGALGAGIGLAGYRLYDSVRKKENPAPLPNPRPNNLNNSNLLYDANGKTWMFDTASQNIIVATNNAKCHNELLADGFATTDKFAYRSMDCYSKSLKKMIMDRQGGFYIDFSAAVCAGFAITGAKTEVGFGIGIDFYGNVAIYGNIGALASFLEKKVSTYGSKKNLWTIIMGAAAGVGGSINYCPYWNDVRDLFGLSYAAEFGIGYGIRLTYDDTENFKGFGINWGTSGYVYTDSRNKGLILSWKELFLLFSNSKSKVLLGYGWFDYEIDRDGYLNILVPDFRFVTDIKMIAKDDKNDFIISDNANKNLPQKNENK